MANLFALNIEIDYGIEHNKRFSILTLKYDSPFPCVETRDINDNITLIECRIDKPPSASFPKQSLEFFDIYTEIKNRKFHLFIRANIEGNKKIRLFANAFDLKSEIAIPKERPKDSRVWQIIGFEGEIPFLSGKSYNGLNFPIHIPNSALPSIAELNIDASPLTFEEGADLGAFLNLQSYYQNKQDAETIAAADNILNNYPNSIFARDALLYKIRAMSRTTQVPDDAINIAKAWIKAYPTDTNVPEVLYIIAKNYAKLRIFNESRYYYSRILEEFEDSKYAQYALVGMAHNLATNGDRRQPPTLYARAYESAKDLDTASFVALNWAQWALKNDDKKGAENLISKVVSANPNYFLAHIDSSTAQLALWAENGLYALSAKAGESMLKKLTNDNFKEKLMLNVGNWYELASMPSDAYRVYSEFLQLFANESDEIPTIKKRSDNLLFLLDEGDMEKQITQYDYIIATYPNSDNAKLAYQKKAQNLLALGRYKEVLELKPHLEENSEIVKNAYIAIIENIKDCAEMISYYNESRVITNNARELFECLFNVSLFELARGLSSEMLPNASGESKILWLYNEARVNYALNDYNRAASASRDVMGVTKDFAQKLNAGEMLFFSLVNLGRKNEAISVFNELVKIAPQNRALIPMTKEMLSFALNDGDNIAVEKYAKDLIALQKIHKTYEFSPFAELSYADVLFSDNRFSEMLKVLTNLHNANNAESQKAHYLRGSAYYELGNNAKAKAEFQQCVKLNGDFGALCEEVLNRL